jgi:hypothetical protein
MVVQTVRNPFEIEIGSEGEVFMQNMSGYSLVNIQNESNTLFGSV